MTDREAAVAALAAAFHEREECVNWSPGAEDSTIDMGVHRRDAERTLDALSPDDARAIARYLPGTLDHAWAAVEAALPEGWAISDLRHFPAFRSLPSEWQAATRSLALSADRQVWAKGPTPAAAFYALAERLAQR